MDADFELNIYLTFCRTVNLSVQAYNSFVHVYAQFCGIIILYL